MNRKGQFFLLAAVVISLVIISLAATTNEVVVQSGSFEEVDDFSYQVQKETGEVLNYQIYSGITEDRVKEFTDVMAEEIQDKDPETEFIFIFGNDEGMTVSNYAQEDAEVTPIDLQDAIFCRYLPTGGLSPSNNPNEKCINGELNCYACLNKGSGCLSSTAIPEFNNICTRETMTVGGIITQFECVRDGNGIDNCIPIKNEDYDPNSNRGYIPADKLTNDAVTVTISGVDVPVPVTEHKQVFMIVKKKSGDETYIDY